MKMRFFGAVMILALAQGQIAALAQEGETIYLSNASFEDRPQHSRVPNSWFDCGRIRFKQESAPDTQPSGFFSVNKPALDGNTYLGMVVRDNDTWESVSQKMSQSMKKGQCYEFSIYLCRSELYISQSRLSEQQSNYTTPAKLRIYGGFDFCDKQFLLAESSLIVSTRWLEYKFRFEPIDDYSFITFEAFYKTPTLFPYNGNILLDKASAIEPIPCKEPVAENKPKTDPKPETVAKTTPKTPTTPVPNPPKTTPASDARPNLTEATKPETTQVQPKIENADFSTLKRSDISKGQTLRVPNLVFAANDTAISRSSYPILDKLHLFLVKNPDLIIEVGGHTNGICQEDYCNMLSEKRARAVANYLQRKGISSNRLKTKGYGKTMPLSKVPSDPQNQRVEIKILNLSNG